MTRSVRLSKALGLVAGGVAGAFWVGSASAAVLGAPVPGEGLYLSVADNVGTTVGGSAPFTDEDVFVTDQAGTGASAFFAIDTGDLDAFHILENGNYLVSSLFNGTIGGTSFGDADLIEYNPLTGQVVGNFRGIGEGSFTSASADISAVTLDGAGNLYISALGSANSLTHAGGSLDFTDGDIVRIDAAGFASVFVSEGDLFDDGDGDVYGLHWNDDGSLLISTNEDESISGTTFLDGDVFRYDAATGSASLFFSEASFTSANTHDIDAVYFVVPAPGTAVGLVGALALAGRRRR